MKNKKYIFLSYSRVDTKFAKCIANDLRNHGFEVWIDQSHIPGGRHWDNYIEDALRNAFAMVLIVSPASVASENVKDEVSFAKNIGIRIIPVEYQLTKSIPLGWNRIQWITLYKNYNNGIKVLIETLQDKTIENEINATLNYSKYLKIFLYMLIVAGLLFVSYLYLLPELTQKKKPKIQIQNTSLDKRNIVIIGNDNQDINISQE